MTITVRGLAPGCANYYIGGDPPESYTPGGQAGGSYLAAGVEASTPGSYDFDTSSWPPGEFEYDVYQFFGDAPAPGDQMVAQGGSSPVGPGGGRGDGGFPGGLPGGVAMLLLGVG